MSPLVFTLSIQGSGNLCLRFRQALLARHPQATVYDRNQDTEWTQPCSILPPAHPEVADIDVFFRLSGQRDEITVRCRGQHRFFSFNPDHTQNDENRLERQLAAVVDTIEQLLIAASEKAAELPGENGVATEVPEKTPDQD